MTTPTHHPSDMTQWDEIRCQRQHEHHMRKVVTVDLSKPHHYHDYPQIPSHLACRFPMAIWQWDNEEYEEMGLYCPAHDAVSRTIDELGIWEPCETIITLAILQRSDPDSLFVDFGAQVGWFTVLACQARRDVIAFEADPDCMSIVRQNMELNGWDDHVSYIPHRVDARYAETWNRNSQTPGRRIALAKIDIEGAEEHAVEILWQPIEQGLVDHLLIEISPVFNDSYPDLVVRLLEAGYEAWIMPEKSMPPPPLNGFPMDLESGRLWPLAEDLQRTLQSEWHAFERVKAKVAGWHQANVLFSRIGAWA